MAKIIHLLSGGINPDANNYSQYLQIKRLEKYYSGLFGKNVTVQFGAGHIPNAPDGQLHDVKIIVLDSKGERKTSFVQGEIPGNQPATRPYVDAYLDTLSQRIWSNDDTFFMFVGDHGSPSDHELSCFDYEATETGWTKTNDFTGNCINLWSPEIELYPEQACLDVQDFKSQLDLALPDSIPAVLVFTQCFSGGFHRMGYSFDSEGYPVKDDQEFAAFSATHDKTTAAGCTAFVDNDRYDGYERRIVEMLTGLSVITGEDIETPEPNLLAAHIGASLLDRTKDTPLRTSEFFMLDAYTGYNGVDSDDSETPSMDEQLNQIWKNIKQNPDGIDCDDPVLLSDLTRRLEYTDDLVSQIKEWFPSLRNQALQQDINGIRSVMESFSEINGAFGQTIKDLKEKRNKIMAKPNTAYMSAVKDKKLGDEAYEFESRDELMRDDLVRLRYTEEDPTLSRYADYVNYTNEWQDTVLEWAQANPEAGFENLNEVPSLNTQISVLQDQQEENEIILGCLKRIEQQMIVASMTLWLIQQKGQRAKKLLKDFKEFIQTEEKARI